MAHRRQQKTKSPAVHSIPGLSLGAFSFGKAAFRPCFLLQCLESSSLLFLLLLKLQVRLVEIFGLLFGLLQRLCLAALLAHHFVLLCDLSLAAPAAIRQEQLSYTCVLRAVAAKAPLPCICALVMQHAAVYGARLGGVMLEAIVGVELHALNWLTWLLQALPNRL